MVPLLPQRSQNVLGCQALVGLGDAPYPLRVFRRSETPGSFTKLCVAEAGARVQPGGRVEITGIVHDTHPGRPGTGTAMCRVRVLGRYRAHRTAGGMSLLEQIGHRASPRTFHCIACGATVRSHTLTVPAADCDATPGERGAAVATQVQRLLEEHQIPLWQLGPADREHLARKYGLDPAERQAFERRMNEIAAAASPGSSPGARRPHGPVLQALAPA